MDAPAVQPTIPPIPQPVPPPVEPTPPPVARAKQNNTLVPVLIVFIVLVTLGPAGFIAYQYIQQKQQATILTFEACSKTPGSMVQTSYPAVCVTRNGKRFTQPLTAEEQKNLLPPDPTANWKTYTNLRYGYAVKYPQDWKVIRWGVGPEATASSDSYDVAIVSPTIVMGCANNPGTLVIEETSDIPGTARHLADPDAINPQKTSVYVNGSQALSAVESVEKNRSRVDTRCVDNEIVTRSVVKNPKDNQGIVFEIDDTLQKEYANTFNQILSTFKFINQNNPTGGQQINCPTTRPQVCPMLCIQPPPYICGSDGKSYCSECQACGNPRVSWYVTQNAPCTVK